MGHREISVALEAWREALREAEGSQPEAPDHAALEAEVETARLAYRAAVLRLTGRKDQPEGAADATMERLRSSRRTLDDVTPREGGPPEPLRPTGR
jgi:DNA-directed RNA polymerase specialized sigma24 family protein